MAGLGSVKGTACPADPNDRRVQNSGPNAWRILYKYDNQTRITEFGSQRRYSYTNPIGSGAPAAPAGCAVGTQNRPHALKAINTASGTPVEWIAYDCNGSMVRRTETPTGPIPRATDYGWDVRNRLQTIITSLSRKTNIYDPNGTLILTQHSGGTIKTVYLGAIEVRYVGSPNGLVASKHPVPGVTVDFNTLRSYTTHDHQRSIDHDTRSTTTIDIYYKPYGQMLEENQNISSPEDNDQTTVVAGRSFLNQIRDTANGLNYLHNRFYAPGLGVLLSVDPIGRADNPASLNPYIYARGNPVALADPSGLDPDTAAWVRERAKEEGYCTYSATVSGGNVCGPSTGTYYGTARASASSGSLDRYSLSELKRRVNLFMISAYAPRIATAPPNASLGPDARPYEYETSGPGYPNDESIRSLTALLGPSIVQRLLDYLSAPSAVNQNWPEEIDALAAGKGLEWSGPHQVDACATSAAGATIYCVAAQRLPSGDPDADAVTWGHFIFYDVDEDAAIMQADGRYTIDRGYLAHEMVHVAQWEQHGDAFVERYLVDPGRWEREAYEVGP